MNELEKINFKLYFKLSFKYIFSILFVIVTLRVFMIVLSERDEAMSFGSIALGYSIITLGALVVSLLLATFIVYGERE